MKPSSGETTKPASLEAHSRSLVFDYAHATDVRDVGRIIMTQLHCFTKGGEV